MNASVYELLALAMRYWFILLMGIILFLLIQSFVREWRIERDVQRRIANAAARFCLRLVSGEDRRIKTGRLYLLEGDMLLGRSAACDIAIRSRVLQARHLVLRPEEDSVLLFPEGAAFAAVDGEQVRKMGRIHLGQRLQAGGLLFDLVEAESVGEEARTWKRS